MNNVMTSWFESFKERFGRTSTNVMNISKIHETDGIMHQIPVTFAIFEIK